MNKLVYVHFKAYLNSETEQLWELHTLVSCMEEMNNSNQVENSG